MSSRRKGSNPINRRSFNYKSQMLDDVKNPEEEEESDDEQLTIPPDLFQDFLQLKTSTHLNTSQLMRKLIQDYSQAAQRSSPRSNTQSPSITPEVNYEIVAESHVTQSCPPPEDLELDQPLDLTVEKSQNGSLSTSPVQNTSPLSMHLPTITMKNNELPFIKTESQEMLKTAVKLEPGIQSLMPTTTVENPLILNGIPNLIAVPFLQTPHLLENMPRLPGIPVPIKSEPSTQPVQLPTPTPAPRGRRPGRKPRGGGIARPAKALPGEMKIIAENTLFPGVYTSILKLPWSRRSRNKPPLTQQAQEEAPVIKQEPVVDSSMSISSEVISESVSSTNPNNTLLLPASSQTIMSATTSQSVMMVYPNASISAVGKPVRRRGRPPKLPMLCHLLSEKKSKKVTADTKVTNTQDLNRPIPVPMITDSMSFIQCNPIPVSAPLDLPAQLDIPSVVKMEPPSPPQSETVDSTPDLRTQADPNRPTMYQEMILSSKSLVNVRLRKRQSPDIKKGSDFMWTSFKIKPRGGKIRLMERRKKNLNVPCESSFEEEMDTNNTETELDDQNSPNMFQELYHCKICNAILPADGKILHQQEHRASMMTCSLCKSGFVSYSNSNSDHEDSTLCTSCSKATVLPSNPALKSMYHKFTCDLCDAGFKSFHAFNDHRHKAHGNEKITVDTHSCLECGKIFFTTKGLNHHMKTHMDKTKKQIIGNGSKLFQIPSLEKPMETDESEICDIEDDSFVCDLEDCKEVFDNYTLLVEHINCKHPRSECLLCPWPGCGMRFTSDEQLKSHILSHRDEKPLKCDFCDYRCRQKNALSWHVRKHPEAAFKYRKYQASLGNE